jgi:hypothetical protein
MGAETYDVDLSHSERENSEKQGESEGAGFTPGPGLTDDS